MTHSQALQGLYDMSQVLLHKNKIILPSLTAVPVGIWEVRVTFSFITEHTVYVLAMLLCSFYGKWCFKEFSFIHQMMPVCRIFIFTAT
jgi:hypothetical protein